MSRVSTRLALGGEACTGRLESGADTTRCQTLLACVCVDCDHDEHYTFDGNFQILIFTHRNGNVAVLTLDGAGSYVVKREDVLSCLKTEPAHCFRHCLDLRLVFQRC